MQGRHLREPAVHPALAACGNEDNIAVRQVGRFDIVVGTRGDLVKSAPLHDIGKVGIADSILLKPGTLTPEERQEIQRHCEMGARVLRIAEKKLKFQSFLTIAIQLTLYHHEKWDGTGYPNGLAGEAIPLSGRIMALADNYDALRTTRPYKSAFSHEQSRGIIQENRGTHFDPALVDAFLRREADFRRISEELSD